jgi:hypothetical protein
MANKKFLAGMLAAALTFGMVFLGCENGVQEVEGAVSISQPQVAAPVIQEVVAGKYVILAWDAVADASGYSVFTNQKDKKAINSASFTPTNTLIYNSDGTNAVNSDSDKWNVKIPLSVAFGADRKEYRYGVKAQAGRYDGRNWYDSGITWGEYRLQTDHPYTALLGGKWVKEAAGEGEEQGFLFTKTTNPSSPITYVVYSQTGAVLDSGSLYDISGDAVSFSIDINGSNTQIYMTGDGKLNVSNSDSSGYSYLNGLYKR